jgi:uncharacterized membrane protein YeaQ/YmgE (transglycosylase-associated protein family)
MGSSGNGAKAGLIAGIAYGVVLAVVAYAALVANKSTVISSITSSLSKSSSTVNITPEQVYNIALIVAPVFVVILGLVGGLILGAIYGRFVEKIPGGTTLMKGVIFGIILWLLVSVLGGVGDLGSYGAGYYLTNIAAGLVGALIFGVLLGTFYGRFSKPKETYELKDDVGAAKVG